MAVVLFLFLFTGKISVAAPSHIPLEKLGRLSEWQPSAEKDFLESANSRISYPELNNDRISDLRLDLQDPCFDPASNRLILKTDVDYSYCKVSQSKAHLYHSSSPFSQLGYQNEYDTDRLFLNMKW